MDKYNPLISIIIPVYNPGKYFRRCIDSVLKQTYSNYELLLIDDCSTDGSGIVCDEYALMDSRVKVIHQKSNNGVTITRNIGLDNAVGKYIAFIDDDDYIDIEYLNTFITYLPKEGKAELITQQIEYSPCPSKTIIYSGYDALCGLWGKIFNRTIIEEYHLRLIPHLKYSEDVLFLIQYLNKIDKVDEIPIAHYHYQLNDNSASLKLDNDYEATSVGLIKLLHLLEENNFRNQYSKEYTQSRVYILFQRIIKSFYNYRSNSIHNRRKIFKEVMTCTPLALDYFPIQYKADTIVVKLLRVRLYCAADALNSLMWQIRKNKT